MSEHQTNYTFIRTTESKFSYYTKQLLDISQGAYDELTSSGGKFSYFECNDKLFPSARPIQSRYKRDNGNVLVDISKFYQEEGNILLVGEGGSGKTTSLVSAWKKLLENFNDLQLIPLYIPLNEANKPDDNETHGNRDNSFIKSYIEDFYGIDLSDVCDNFSKSNTQNVKIILLLDGFNEIGDRNTQISISKEIKKYNKRKDFRFIMTSRFDFSATYELDNFRKYNILPLNNQIIEEYLNDVGIQSISIPLQILSNPMILTLYANMCIIKERISELLYLPFYENNTKGEIIANFLLCQIGKVFSIENIPKIYFNYMALFIVCPYIAYSMEKEGRFDMDYADVNGQIRMALNYYSDKYDYLFGRDLFSLLRYDPFSVNISQSTINRIFKLMLEDLAIVQINGRSLWFRHQYFRDFFSSWFILNEIDFFINTNNTPQSLLARILPEYIASIIGDLKQEYLTNNKRGGYFDNLIKKLPKAELDNKDLMLNNIIIIQRLSKNNNLSSIDLSGQDLRNISLNGIQFSDNGRFAKFNKSLIAKRTFLPQGHIGQVRSAVFSKDSQIVLSAGDTTIKEWDCVTGLCINTYIGHTNLVNTAFFHPKEERVLSAANDNTVREWDRKGNCLYVFSDHKSYVTKAIYDSTGNRIFSCSWDGTVLSYTRTNNGWSAPTVVAKHEKNIKNIALNSDETILLTASGDGTVKEWQLSNPLRLLNSYSGHEDMVNTVVFADNDNYIVSGGYDNMVIVFVRGKTQKSNSINIFDAWVRSVVYDSKSKAILIASHDSNIYEYSFSPNKSCPLISKYVGHAKAVTNISLNDDGSKIVSTSEDGSIREWDRKSGQCIRVYAGNDFSLTNTVYSNDGRSVITIKDYIFIVSKRNDGIPYFTSHESVTPISNAVFGENDNIVLYTTKDGLYQTSTLNNNTPPICLIDSKSVECSMMYAKHDRRTNTIVAIGKKADDTSIVFFLNKNQSVISICIPFSAEYADILSDSEVLTFSSGGIIRIWDMISGMQKGVFGVKVEGCCFKNCIFEDDVIKEVILESGGIV